MQIVIEIPEEIKNECDNDTFERATNYVSWFNGTLVMAIKNGTPLPKGHGRLIDVSNLLTVTDIKSDGSEFTYVSYSEIDDAPTIIPADKDGD